MHSTQTRMNVNFNVQQWSLLSRFTIIHWLAANNCIKLMWWKFMFHLCFIHVIFWQAAAKIHLKVCHLNVAQTICIHYLCSSFNKNLGKCPCLFHVFVCELKNNQLRSHYNLPKHAVTHLTINPSGWVLIADTVAKWKKA